MKLKNILSILIVLFVATSCSMESDTIMNDIEKEASATTGAKELNAYVAFDLRMGSAQTKSVEADKAINNVVLFLLDGDKVIASTYAANYNEVKFLVKVPQSGERKLQAMAIVNVSEATKASLLSETTLAGINGVTFNETDLSNYVKVGTDNDVKLVGSSAESATKFDEDYYTVTAEIEVKQMTSRVELTGFTYKLAEGMSSKVTLVSAQLINANGIGNVAGTATVYSEKQYDANANVNGIATPVLLGSSFAHGAENPVTVVLKFTVDTREYTKSYVINRPGVSDHNYIQPGNIYQLSVNMTISKDWVEGVDIQCFTKDWVDNEIDIEL